MSEDREVPRDQIEKANEDIVGVIGRHIQLKKTGKNWSACCPFHSERSPSFTVSPEKGMYYCFGCGAGGDAVRFVRDYLGIGFRDAVESINGNLTLERSDGYQYAQSRPKAVHCSLPGHAEDREKTARVLHECDAAWQHPYLLKNNAAPDPGCLTRRGHLMVLMVNNIGEKVNMAAVSAEGQITYAAGKPSFGSTAILHPANEPDGKTIICQDYAHAWRLWWSQGGRSQVLCAMDPGNLSWMLANCKDRFTHVGCDPLETEWFEEQGFEVVALPVDPYAASARNRQQVDLSAEAS